MNIFPKIGISREARSIVSTVFSALADGPVPVIPQLFLVEFCFFISAILVSTDRIYSLNSGIALLSIWQTGHAKVGATYRGNSTTRQDVKRSFFMFYFVGRVSSFLSVSRISSMIFIIP